MSPDNTSPLSPDIPLDGPVVVFSLEWTAWEGSRERDWSGPREEREIVEIAAVKLDGADGLQETMVFENLARPMKNPIVSQYFTELTGITQTQLDNYAMPFGESLTLFEGFVGYDGAPVLCMGRDEDILRHNCALNHLPCPFPDNQLHNIGPTIAAAAERPVSSISAKNLPEIFAFPPPVDSHRALSDVRCLTEALRVLTGRHPPGEATVH